MRNVRPFHIAIRNNPDPRNHDDWHQGPISNRLSRARRLARKLGQNAMLFQEAEHGGGRTWSNLKRISLYVTKEYLKSMPLVGHGGQVKVGHNGNGTSSLRDSALSKI